MISYFSLLLVVVNCYLCDAEEILDIVPGMFSKKVISNGLTLPATSTFKPIPSLTTTIHLVDKRYAVFFHYQITMGTGNHDFYSKLLINYANAGSLVHSGKQYYKTTTGFYMANLNPGYYTIEIHYKSPVAINMLAYWDWQTAILQVIWVEDSSVASDNIKCFPSLTTTNTYNWWGPIRDTEAVLYLPSDRVILSAYQFSVEMTAPGFMVTALGIDGFHQYTTSFLKGNNQFLDLHGAWAGYARKGVHYFSIQYRTLFSLSFTDCKENYKNNKNLYAMMLPPSCRVSTINPKTSLTFSNSNSWAPTDVTTSFTLSKQSHVIIMYQFSGYCGDSHIVMRLSINSVPQKHTVSLTGNTVFAGNYGLWQGSLNSGAHKITLDYRTPAKTTNTVSPNLDWQQVHGYGIWHNRVLTVVTC